LLAVYSLRYVKSPGTLAFSFILLSISLYAFGYAFELMSESLTDILFWLRIEYLGISFLPSLFIILALQYTGRSNLLKPWLVILLFSFSIFTFFFQFTNYNKLFYTQFRLDQYTNFTLAAFKKGIWYWIHQLFANLMLLFSCILYLLMIIHSHGINRARAAILLFASIIPWGFYIVYLSGGSPHNIDLSPFSFSIVGILGALGIFRYHLLDYVPLALEHVFDSMTDGVIILDNNNRLIEFNHSALDIFPELNKDLKGKDFVPVSEKYPELSFSTKEPEKDIALKDATAPSYYHLRKVPVTNERKQLLGRALIISNITERKIKEMKLMAIEKKLTELNKSKDKFLAIIAHDLRNSFHLIINMSEIMVNSLEADDSKGILKKSKIIYDTALTTYDLLQNLLDWALIQQKGMHFRPHVLHPARLVEEVVDSMSTICEQKELKIIHQVDNHLKTWGDAEMLKIVLRNLISNAVKYSYPGGLIKVSAKSSDGFVTFEITDEGIGMTLEEQEKLFRLDSGLSRKGTASETGTGLGLVLCHEFIQTHGGRIWVNSTPGKGSIFSFNIPVQK
jgi:signal transduction histidine kinase